MQNQHGYCHRFPRNTITEALCLTGLWTLTHSMDRDFAHISEVYHSLFKIDYIFGTNSALSSLIRILCISAWISDHAPVSVLLHNGSARPDYINWRFPANLAQDKSFHWMIKEEWEDYATHNVEHIYPCVEGLSKDVPCHCFSLILRMNPCPDYQMTLRISLV